MQPSSPRNHAPLALSQPKINPARWRAAARWLLPGLALLLAGCPSTPTVSIPEISPDAAAKQALAEYDTNHDGFLDARELERCPALKASLKSLDTNRDGKLSADEIAARLQLMMEQKSLTTANCQVLMNNEPLQDATVTFVPEKFMGPAIKAATGKTDDYGYAALQIEGEELPGVSYGFYRVEISKKNEQGQETIPARYNTKTTLGRELAPVTREKDTPFRLTSGR
jgi:hypothetical protein